jgi:hypothetical protein
MHLTVCWKGLELCMKVTGERYWVNVGRCVFDVMIPYGDHPFAVGMVGLIKATLEVVVALQCFSNYL